MVWRYIMHAYRSSRPQMTPRVSTPPTSATSIKAWDACRRAQRTPKPYQFDGILIACLFPCAESLNELSKVENADPNGINSVKFSPDGKTIVSGGASGTIKVWDAGNGNLAS